MNDTEGPAEGERKRARVAPSRGRVLVAKYYPGKPQPVAPAGCRNVLIHSSSQGLGGPLSPFILKDDRGQLLENVWQFSKLYRKVTRQRTALGRHHPDTIVWEHPAEVHVDEQGEPNAAYWKWREKGMSNARAVRYPNGYGGRTKCVCAIVGNERLASAFTAISTFALRPPHKRFRHCTPCLSLGKTFKSSRWTGPTPRSHARHTTKFRRSALAWKCAKRPSVCCYTTRANPSGTDT
jgi:hypothetical protein